MKKVLQIFIIISLAILYSNFASAQCTNGTAFGTANAPTSDVPLQISTTTYETEYNTVNNVVAGQTYVSTSSCGSYITVRSGSSGGTVVAHGWSPLTWTAVVNGSHYIHYNTSAACGTATNFCTTTITCTSCSPPPDPCDAAINIPSVPVTNQAVVCGSVNGLTSANSNVCGGATTSYMGGFEAVYTFTPTESGVYTIAYSGQTYSAIWVHSGACPSDGGTCVGSSGSSLADETLDVNLTAGVLYYIWFDTYPTPDSPCPGTFSITPPPCTPANVTITQNCAGDNSYYDLSIVINNMVEASTVNIVVGGTTYYSGVGVGTYAVNNITTNVTVQIIDAADPSCVYSEAISVCDLCNGPTVPSDLCVNAPLIDLSQPFSGTTDCSYTVGPTYPTESCGIFLDNDSWMTFIAGSTDVEMDYTVGDCTPQNSGIQLTVFYGANCGSLTELPGSCVNPTGENVTGTWNFSGLTIGETYWIRIDGYAGDLCDYYFEPISGVVITPDNDECDNAMILDCGGSDIASNILATAIDAPIGCAGGGTPTEGVWYTFTGNGQQIILSTDNPGTNFNTAINVYQGPCTSLVCVGGDISSGTGTTSSFSFNSTVGVEYLIYVHGEAGATGQFEISLECIDDPCDADAGIWD